MNNTDKDETVVVRCTTEGCDEIMGRNGDGNLVCTSCGRVVEVNTYDKPSLQDSLKVMTPEELEFAIRDAGYHLYYGLNVKKYADQISACIAEQKRRG